MASAAVTGLLLSATLGAAPVAAQQAVASDSSFIQMAASLGLLQAKLGKMAAEKGSSPNVKEFGKRMVEEYSKANEELAAGAKQAAFPAPLLLRQHKQIVDQFLGMNGSSFDKSYLAQAVSDHNEAVRLFKQEAEGGKVASLKALASRMLPRAWCAAHPGWDLPERYAIEFRPEHTAEICAAHGLRFPGMPEG